MVNIMAKFKQNEAISLADKLWRTIKQFYQFSLVWQFSY
jgi:hypothetical protein